MFEALRAAAGRAGGNRPGNRGDRRRGCDGAGECNTPGTPGTPGTPDTPDVLGLLGELAGVDLATLDDAAVRECFIELRAAAEQVELLCARFAAALDRRGIPAGDGATSTPVWVQHHTGQLRAEARASLQMGLALDGFPSVQAAWSAGEITASAARLIVGGRRAGAEREYHEVESALVGFASRREYGAMRRVIGYYQARVDDRCAPHEPEGLFLGRVGASWSVRGSLDGAAGEYLAAAIDAAMGPPLRDEVRSPAQRRAEALGVVARAFCATGPGAGEHPAPVAVHVVVDWHSLSAEVPASAVGTHGLPLRAGALGRLLCDAQVVRVVSGPEGEVLDVGRARRVPTRAQRRAVLVRDRHCRFPGCDRPAGWGEVHHVVPWHRGGPTDLANLVLLCGSHHRLVHQSDWTVKFDGAELVVVTPSGREMRSRPPGCAPRGG